jgi:hypothetical protein
MGLDSSRDERHGRPVPIPREPVIVAIGDDPDRHPCWKA